MQFEKRRASVKQEIPTASMPDIVFMLLLFFMVTTTLREVDVLVDFRLPEAKAIEKIENKRLISYIWVGKDKRMQINDVIVSLRVDKGTDMGLVTDIQQELRKAYCLRLNYSSTIKI